MSTTATEYSFRSASQARVFAYIASYFAQYRAVPSYRLIRDHFNWSSRNAALCAVRRLEREGLLVRIAPRVGTGGRSLLVPAGFKVRPSQSQRLPIVKPDTDRGFIYVAKRENAYKIGFSRSGVRRRVKDCGGELVLTIPTKARPSVLESLIHQRFAEKRLPPQGSKPGDKREWYSLDSSDIDWLRSFSAFMTTTHAAL